MGAFNKSNSGANRPEKQVERMVNDSIRNHEGGVAFQHSAKTELAMAVCTSMMTPQDMFYETANDAHQRLLSTTRAVLEEDPIFVLKLAAFARNELYLRSVPMLLVSEYANSDAQVPDSRKYLSQIVQRPDEITELIALSQQSIENGTRKKHSQFILKGVKEAFSRFDERTLKKYNGKYSAVKLRDAMFLTHPVPPKGMGAFYNDLANNNVGRNEDDWWIRFMKEKQTPEAWAESMDKMGYLGVLQNTKKLLDNSVEVDAVCERLVNPKAIHKSKVLPFRYLTAAKALQPSDGIVPNSYKKALRAISDAMDASAINVPELPGRTLMLVDVSGSMTSNYIKKSKNARFTTGDINCKQIATLLASIFLMNNKDETSAIAFAQDFKEYVPIGDLSVMAMANQMSRISVGGCTYPHKPLQWVLEQDVKYDRIILLSDMQCYDEATWGGWWSQKDIHASLVKATVEYRTKFPDTKIYSIDLAGYGHAVLPEEYQDTVFIAGWNENIFKFIDSYETGAVSMIDAIEQIGTKEE